MSVAVPTVGDIRTKGKKAVLVLRCSQSSDGKRRVEITTGTDRACARCSVSGEGVRSISHGPRLIRVWRDQWEFAFGKRETRTFFRGQANVKHEAQSGIREPSLSFIFL